MARNYRLPKSKKKLNNTHRKICKEWHPTKNGNLTPKDVSYGSGKKVWWKCKNGHEWICKVQTRTEGSKCPYCSGKKVCKDNCLKKLRPDLAKEWHPTKNGKLTSKDVTCGSAIDIWWKCKKGHEWRAKVVSRKYGNVCGICSGFKRYEDTSFAAVCPQLIKEWHSTKNGALTPKDVSYGSNKKVWWICDKGHEWKTYVTVRSQGKRCPYCYNKKANKENCFATLKPKLAKEWHPTKNGKLSPKEFLPYSSKKVWWKCEKEHEWQTAISSRSMGSKCPYCMHTKASKEYNLYTYNRKLSREWHPTKNGKLRPKDVLPYSHKMVWWICKNGHEWKATSFDRSTGFKCTICNLKKKRK